MCGIAGIVNFNLVDNVKSINKMINALRHRGPDSYNIICNSYIQFAHSRLSIIDIDGGGQPMCCSKSGNLIVFNGEIYGYKSIRSSLDNYNFTTNSDTEVILALYEKYKFDLFTHLPGMFSFAIWDKTTNSVFCARDRFGEKPFYYTFGKNGEFIFASEIKSILASDLVTPEIDLSSISFYLKRLSVPVNRTIYKNIFVLPPAHYLVFTKNEFYVKRYWNLPTTNNSISDVDAYITFKDLFEKSIKKQLVSDVPIGAFLSGGIDSNAVVALASKFYPYKLNTYTFGYKGTQNELKAARKTASFLSTNHTEIYDSDYDISDVFELMQEVYDEPFADSSNIPTFIVSNLASKSVKVVLSGDGGDEMLAGYKTWYQHLFSLQHRKSYSYILNELYNKINHNSFFPSIFQKSQDTFNKIRNKTLIADQHLLNNVYFNDNQIFELGLPVAHNYIFEFQYSNSLNDALSIDIQNYMPSDILLKIDRASMYNGLEIRSPFLDVEFSEFCMSLPVNFKFSKNQNKILLRKYIKNEFPNLEIDPQKKGFGSPVGLLLKNKRLRELKNDILYSRNSKIFNYLPFDVVNKYIDSSNYFTWILLTLSIWIERNKYL